MTWTTPISFDFRQRATVFAAAALSIYWVALNLVASLDGFAAVEARRIAWGVTADLVILVPILYWLLVVRGGAPRFTVVPVTVLSLSIAGAVLPVGYRQGVHLLEAAAIPLELGIAGLLIWRVRRAILAEQGASDFFERLRGSAARLLGAGRGADILAFETALFFYAFASWREKPPSSAQHFTHHKRDLFHLLAIGGSLATAVEIVPVHLLVTRWWSPTAAMVLTLLGVYSLIWLIGDYRAVKLRPSLIKAGCWHLRIGLRWNAEIPLENVRAITRFHVAPTDPDYLRVALIGEPRHLVELSEPVEIRGPYGIRKQARLLGISLDDEAAFEKALSLRPLEVE